jgi:DNA gyrase subunit B
MSYTAIDMEVLEGRDYVRKRPTVFIATIDNDGKTHCVKEIIDNSLDELIGGHGHTITVDISDDGLVTVEDNGRGIPTDINPKTGLTGVQMAATKLGGGGKFNKDNYKISGGLNGLGLALVNFLSEFMEIDVYRNGDHHNYKFKDGIQVHHSFSKAAKLLKDHTGTIVRFKLDNTLFKEATNPNIEIETIREMIIQRAYLNKGVRIIFNGTTYHSENGLPDYMDYIYSKNNLSGKIVDTISGEVTDPTTNVSVKFALSYSNSKNDYDAIEYTFCNSLYTFDGGKHLTGFRMGLTRAVNSLFRLREKDIPQKDRSIKISGDDIRENVVVIISVSHPEPQFLGNRKSELNNSDVQGITDTLINTTIQQYFERHPTAFKPLMNKIILAAKSREAAKRSRDTILRKDDLFAGSSAAKLSPCESDDPRITELFLTEGDSAGGTAKKARDRIIQAIFPLKGKILNTEGSDPLKAMKNTEISDLVTILGTGIGKHFNLENLKYSKIIILSDADVDGLHIKSLAETLFLNHLKPIIEAGNLYVGCPPLYVVKENKEKFFVSDDIELSMFFTSRLSKSLGIKIEKPKLKEFNSLVMTLNNLYNSLNSVVNRFGIPYQLLDAILLNDELFFDSANSCKFIDAYRRVSSEPVIEIGGIVQITWDTNPYSVPLNHFNNEISIPLEIINSIISTDIFNYLLDIDKIASTQSIYEICKIVHNLSQKGLEITYLKGLGEMSYEDLRVTTMCPKTRVLKRIVITDDKLALETCATLMGSAGKYASMRRGIMDEAFASTNINSVDIQ